MNQMRVSRLSADLRPVSPIPVYALLLAAAIAITFEPNLLPNPTKAVDVALILYAPGLVGVALAVWRPRISHWFTLLALTAVILLVNSWLGVPGILALLGIPAALAAILIGLQAAVAAAAAESILLLASLGWHVPGIGWPDVAIALVAIWAIVAAMLAAYKPVYELAAWSWNYYEHAKKLLAETHARRIEHKQALSDLAHVNRQLAFTNEKLAAARLAAEESQKAKAAFVAKVSHEFRTPLNMIIGLVDLLMSARDVYGQELPPALFEDLQIVHRNCEHLSSMISDVLDLSQVEGGRLVLHKERVDLAEVIERAVAVVRPLVDKKGLVLDVAVPEDLPEVYCDRTRIRQVIVNLLSNAARFTEKGSIAIRACSTDQRITISVSDTGPGIPPEDAGRVFEPFYQGLLQTHTSPGGSGLGLSISKQFVELHDGKMWFESMPGVGSTFFFLLPISPPIVPSVSPASRLVEDWTWVERTSQAHLPLTSLKPRLVLCDETGELATLFARCPSEIEFVTAGAVSEAVVEAQRNAARAVLVNVAQPESLVEWMQETRRLLRETPIIGFSLPPRLDHVAAAGALRYLSKPVLLGDLQCCLQKLGMPVQRVLIVDDSADAQQLFTRMLLTCNSSLQVTAAATGQEALAMLRSEPTDLVLLDIVLPDIDGWRFLELKKQDETISGIPVVIVSARDLEEEPLVSEELLVMMGEGLSVNQLLRCSLALSSLLQQPG